MNHSNSRRVDCLVELVEPRRLLAAIEVVGNSSNDTVVIQVSNAQITVTLNGNSQSYPDDDYSEIDVRLLEGEDTVDVVTNGDNAVSVWGGSGNDTLRVGTTTQHAQASFASGGGEDNLYVNQDDSGTAIARLLLEDGSKIERLALIDVRAGGIYEIPTGIGYASLVSDDEQLYGTIDLNDNSWIIKDGPAGTPNISVVRSVIVKGYNAGAWSGADAAVRSSVCYDTPAPDGIGYAYAQDITRTSLNGLDISGEDVLMAYTLCGDVNFDFTVGFTDLLTVAQKYGTSSDGHWFDGDSNYDGVVDFNDLISVAQNYGETIANAPSARIGMVGKVTGAPTLFTNLFSNYARMVDVVG